MYIRMADIDRSVRVLTIDRPPVNALNEEVIDELNQAVQAAMLDGNIRAIVITGAGKMFVAGADLDRLAAADETRGRGLVSCVKALHHIMAKGTKPVIAAINGVAAGGGLELAMACDIRIAEKNARLGLPEATLGVIPGAGGTQMMPRLIGLGKALELMLTGQLISSEEALAIGLIEQVATTETALEMALRIAGLIAKNAPIAIAEIKAGAYDCLSLPLDQGLDEETNRFGRICATKDKNEGISAFKMRRPPIFSGV
jgi:enoyl-CoA hydratase/carnithine racemase